MRLPLLERASYHRPHVATLRLYSVTSVWGVQYGYEGFYSTKMPPKPLTADIVKNLHDIGGTVLGSSRGTPLSRLYFLSPRTSLLHDHKKRFSSQLMERDGSGVEDSRTALLRL